jgi:hypothetical protein
MRKINKDIKEEVRKDKQTEEKEWGKGKNKQEVLGRTNGSLLDGLLNYSSTLKMEAIRSSETSGATLRTTRRHIPGDDTLQNHRCENLKS